MSQSPELISKTQLASLKKVAKTYQAGETICIEGEPSRDLMLLLQGAVEVIRSGDVVNTIRGQQIFLGQIAFFASQRRTATLKAKSRCEIVKIREDRIEQLLASMPSLSLRLIADITQLFVQKEQELARYREFGTSTHQAMQSEGLANVVQSFLPGLLVSLLQELSDDVRLGLAEALLDALSVRMDLTSLVINKASIPPEVRRKVLRTALEEGLIEMIREKSAGAQVGGGGSGASFSALETEYDACRNQMQRMQGETLSMGAESELERFAKTLRVSHRCACQNRPDDALDAITTAASHGEKLLEFASLARSSKGVKDQAEALLERIEAISEGLKNMQADEGVGASRQQILSHLRFEI